MLEWTGERFLPWIKESAIAYEHLHRYAYASALVKGKRVLDLACGEGYGSKMLSDTAASVLGIDVDEIAVRHAAHKYGNENLKFRAGSITAIPVAEDQSFDVIVCFEAIEHIENQEALLSEVTRLLSPSGIFIVSTPNKAVYHDESAEENPFHVKELYFEEFRTLLARYFGNTRFLGQRIHPGSSIWPIGASNSKGFHEFVIARGDSDFRFITAEARVPLYFIAIASNDAEDLPPSGSVLLDHSDSLIEGKDEEVRSRERQITERDQTIASMQEAMKWREGQIRELTEGLQWTRDCIAEQGKTIASQEEALVWRASQVSDIERRAAALNVTIASLTASLQTKELELSAATESLARIYATRWWQFILKIRRIRDSLIGLVKSRG